MKRIGLLLLSGAVSILLIACDGNTDTQVNVVENTEVEEIVEATSDNIEEINVESEEEKEIEIVEEVEEEESFDLDYANAEDFEAALNAGESVEGKIVQFEVRERHPESMVGYNLWAGEHLNFVSIEPRYAEIGELVIVKVKSAIKDDSGEGASWLIQYDRLSKPTEIDLSAYKNTLDYSSAEEFELALNSGEVGEGKVVEIVVEELKAASAYGYDIWAGDHLNFVSYRHPQVSAGDVIKVYIVDVNDSMGSWILTYEIIDKSRTFNKSSDGTIDYDSAEALEKDLEAGMDLEGKIVSFEVRDVNPDSAVGFNIVAGEHLNFISDSFVDVNPGDTMTVRLTIVGSRMKSWLINYEIIE